MDYNVNGEITSSDDTEMLTALQWLKDNYGTKIGSASATLSTSKISFSIAEVSYNEAVDTFAALKAQYTTRLIECTLSLS